MSIIQMQLDISSLQARLKAYEHTQAGILGKIVESHADLLKIIMEELTELKSKVRDHQNYIYKAKRGQAD